MSHKLEIFLCTKCYHQFVLVFLFTLKNNFDEFYSCSSFLCIYIEMKNNIVSCKDSGQPLYDANGNELMQVL
jgi:hypothetical protein